MLMKSISAVSSPVIQGGANGLGPLMHNTSFSTFFVPMKSTPFENNIVLSKKNGKGLMVFAETSNSPVTGVLFQPFEEVKSKQELAIPVAPEVSLARQLYTQNSESAINEQINVEYNESSEEERGHAEKLMEYQNKRGGRVKLHSIQMPPSEYDHVEKGDALYAMELALSLEKLTNEKLLQVHKVADENNDPSMADFIESEFLHEQVEAIKSISSYVSQLRRVGKGHGVWHFDQMLLHGAH
ncbi:hypothetical protein Leryth_004147 [Lithospermum erythrorhizon]|nr:hypothetical protein Leryth_004147 [Lithospermum erythrorhizon]